MQGLNRSRGLAKGSAQGAQHHMLFQKDHELASSCLLFVMRSCNSRVMFLTNPDLLV
jgi:hypothetical protein